MVSRSGLRWTRPKHPAARRGGRVPRTGRRLGGVFESASSIREGRPAGAVHTVRTNFRLGA